MKRTTDFIIAGMCLVVFSPLMLICALCIRWEDGLPIIYKQERIGLHGKPFYIYKFRSMRIDAEKDGPDLLEIKGDPRLTKVGRFLRAHHLDELPQLWNVFIGDMAFIGPRPELLRYTAQYEGEELLIHRVRPGITDYSSIEFINLDEIVGGENADEMYEKYVLKRKNELRVKYAKTVSFGTDTKLLFITVWDVLKKICRFAFKRKEKV